MSQSGTRSSGGGGTPITTIDGNTGSATGATITLQTVDTTVKFAASGSTVTQDFGLSNLLLGAPGASITTATTNVGLGDNALVALTEGSGNTAIGHSAADSITTGSNNVAIGKNTLVTATGSVQNTAVGVSALQDLSTSTGSNTAIGYAALDTITTGTENIALGEAAGGNLTTSDSSNICIGNAGTSGDNNTIRIGTEGNGAGQQDTCFIAGIVSNALSGSSVVVTATGQLGTGTGNPTWTDQNASFAAAVNNGYFVTAAATATLPAAPTQGQFVQIETTTASSIVIQANTGQVIRMGSSASSTAGTATSAAIGNSVYLVYRSANTSWYSVSTEGTWTMA
jgi:hypothetical protein